MYVDPDDRTINSTDTRLINWLIRFIQLFVTDPTHYQTLVQRISDYRNPPPKVSQSMKYQGLFKLNIVTQYAIATTLLDKDNQFSYHPGLNAAILNKLYRYNVSQDMCNFNSDFDVLLNRDSISLYVQLDCLDNIIMGTNYIIHKYLNSLCHIKVTNSAGDFHGGTDFVILSEGSASSMPLVVTSKHLVDNAPWSPTRMTLPSGDVAFGAIHLSESCDLAGVEIKDEIKQRSMYFDPGMMYLQNVISLGYPYVLAPSKMSQWPIWDRSTDFQKLSTVSN
jgi:hypothetical protein